MPTPVPALRLQVRPLQDEDHLAGEADEEEGHPRRSRGVVIDE